MEENRIERECVCVCVCVCARVERSETAHARTRRFRKFPS